MHFSIYPNNLENREFGKEASQIFRRAQAAVLIDTARARDEKSGTPPCQIPDSPGCLGIDPLRRADPWKRSRWGKKAKKKPKTLLYCVRSGCVNFSADF